MLRFAHAQCLCPALSDIRSHLLAIRIRQPPKVHLLGLDPSLGTWSLSVGTGVLLINCRSSNFSWENSAS